jgi:hypothetical protein
LKEEKLRNVFKSGMQKDLIARTLPSTLPLISPCHPLHPKIKGGLALTLPFVRISIISLTQVGDPLQSITKVYFELRCILEGGATHVFCAPENFRVNNKSLAPRGGTAKSHDGDN